MSPGAATVDNLRLADQVSARNASAEKIPSDGTFLVCPTCGVDKG